MVATQDQINAMARKYVQVVHRGKGHVANVDAPAIVEAVEAAYNHIEADKAAFNADLTATFKAAATTSEKADLFMIAAEAVAKVS